MPAFSADSATEIAMLLGFCSLIYVRSEHFNSVSIGINGRSFLPSLQEAGRAFINASEAEQAFDSITYDKGAAVIAMLEAYVGPTVFRAGVRRYMHAHAYGNTLDADLWKEVQLVAGKPVSQMEAAAPTVTR